ncbi:MAG: transposase, partial [Gemmatimonadetes bacterium]|nr:transposase [Gemmatimonadota bacterium]
MSYRSRRPDQTPLRQRLCKLARQRDGYGHRRVHVLLRREGWRVNHKRTHRLYCDERLQLGRRRVEEHPNSRRREDPNSRTADLTVPSRTALSGGTQPPGAHGEIAGGPRDDREGNGRPAGAGAPDCPAAR